MMKGSHGQPSVTCKNFIKVSRCTVYLACKWKGTCTIHVHVRISSKKFGISDFFFDFWKVVSD